ncbi:hypothetical protein OESDEN_12958 [Oesophagostomum dentatum]|uniref:Uncharacterized protein n=1 Tax=Oesophagostomum dentatum TaxID=61180 RepID=A0A0B1SUR4_OESDE|nr:hypothetical protein OESDEN_12958 [Oesophagostomum dentatum]
MIFRSVVQPTFGRQPAVQTPPPVAPTAAPRAPVAAFTPAPVQPQPQPQPFVPQQERPPQPSQPFRPRTRLPPFQPPTQPFRPQQPFQPQFQTQPPFQPQQFRTQPPPPTTPAPQLPFASQQNLRTGVCPMSIFYISTPINGPTRLSFTHFAIAVTVDQCARTCHEFNCAVSYLFFTF